MIRLPETAGGPRPAHEHLGAQCLRASVLLLVARAPASGSELVGALAGPGRLPDQSAACRALRSLEEEGLVLAEPTTGRYCLSPAGQRRLWSFARRLDAAVYAGAARSIATKAPGRPGGPTLLTRPLAGRGRAAARAGR